MFKDPEHYNRVFYDHIYPLLQQINKTEKGLDDFTKNLLFNNGFENACFEWDTQYKIDITDGTDWGNEDCVTIQLRTGGPVNTPRIRIKYAELADGKFSPRCELYHLERATRGATSKPFPIYFIQAQTNSTSCAWFLIVDTCSLFQQLVRPLIQGCGESYYDIQDAGVRTSGNNPNVKKIDGFLQIDIEAMKKANVSYFIYPHTKDYTPSGQGRLF